LACDGPGWVKRKSTALKDFEYIARCTIRPTTERCSLGGRGVTSVCPIVVPTVRFARMNLGKTSLYGFKPSFNQTFKIADSPTGWWISPYHFGIDQGPVVLMIENYRSELIWNIMRRCPAVVTGLRRAGFKGGWLDG
jgi:hypothetical protein